jgi:beta-xylosidase
VFETTVRRLRRPLLLAVLALAMLGAAAPAGAQSFTNPVIPGDFPDPSVVRADGAYWATATSGNYAPAFPIFRSTDLVHWRQVGSVFPTPPKWARGSFWAPGITVSGGVWSVYYSAARRDGPPCVALAQASSPYGPWQDRGFVVCDEFGAIDAGAVTDPASGLRYLVYKRKGVGEGIYGALLSADGARLESPPQLLVEPDRRWEGAVTEGPDVVMHDGEYFLLYSGGHCCRPPCTYAVGVARAPSILGPYVKSTENPVFHGGDGWKCPGHGTLVDATDGSLAYLHHAYRDDDPFDTHRQALLEPVTWGADGWPVIGDAGVPVGGAAGAQRLSLDDTFAGRALAPGWEWRFNDVPKLKVGGGLLRVAAGTVTRPWVPRSYAVRASLRGDATLGVQLTTGKDVEIRTGGGRAQVLVGGVVTASIALGPIPKPAAPVAAKGAKKKRAKPRPLPTALGVRLHVRDGRAFAAYALVRGKGWRRVGPVVYAPGGTASRLALGPGTYQDVAVTPLG